MLNQDGRLHSASMTLDKLRRCTLSSHQVSNFEGVGFRV